MALAQLIEMLEADLVKAEELSKEAQEILDFGKDAGFDINEQQKTFMAASARVERIKRAIAARKK